MTALSSAEAPWSREGKVKTVERGYAEDPASEQPAVKDEKGLCGGERSLAVGFYLTHLPIFCPFRTNYYSTAAVIV